MDVDGESSSKKMKVDKGRDVIDLDKEEQSINQGGVAIVEENKILFQIVEEKV